ncbi:unnamed protein product, partial [Schistocephalus solidus]|uniref:SH2 domain-containing protein n=1 Tax=Schistocephalus solidus TaxID=70667 RepID=A0A183TML1_SCHSO
MNHTPMNQPLILPTPGYVLPSPGLNVFSPYQPAAGIGPTFSLMPQQHGVPSPVVAQNNSSSSFFMRFAQNPQTSPPTGLSTEGSPNTEKDFRIITWEELRHLFPKPGPEGRVESGLLSDGRAYAQKTAKRDNYFLFPSKSAYILYFMKKGGRFVVHTHNIRLTGWALKAYVVSQLRSFDFNRGYCADFVYVLSRTSSSLDAIVNNDCAE